MSKLVRLDTIARAATWHMHDRCAMPNKAGNKFTVEVHWSRALTIQHEATFDNVDDALKLVKRINDRGSITPSCWLMPAREAA